MKYNYFIAARWRNKDNILLLANKIRQKGKTVYNCIEGQKDLNNSLKKEREEESVEEYMNKFESIPNWKNDKTVKQIFNVDMNALKESEKFILLLPAGKSAHIEAGAAYGMGKRCIVIGEQKETESLYLIFNEFYQTIDDFINSIK